MEKNNLEDAIISTLTSPNVLDENGEPANIVDAIAGLSDAIFKGFRHLGLGDATTNGWGAIESATLKIEKAIDGLASAVSGVSDGLFQIAEAIEKLADKK